MKQEPSYLGVWGGCQIACKSAADYANAGITNIGIDSSKVSEGTGSAPAGEKPLALPASILSVVN